MGRLSITLNALRHEFGGVFAPGHLAPQPDQNGFVWQKWPRAGLAPSDRTPRLLFGPRCHGMALRMPRAASPGASARKNFSTLCSLVTDLVGPPPFRLDPSPTWNSFVHATDCLFPNPLGEHGRLVASHLQQITPDQDVKEPHSTSRRKRFPRLPPPTPSLIRRGIIAAPERKKTSLKLRGGRKSGRWMPLASAHYFVESG